MQAAANKLECNEKVTDIKNITAENVEVEISQGIASAEEEKITPGDFTIKETDNKIKTAQHVFEIIAL